MSYGKKVVDGKEVLLTAQEIAALEARDAQWAAGEPARQAEKNRVQALRTNPEAKQLIDQLNVMTAQQVDAYFANNVKGLKEVTDTLRQICKAVAVLLSERGPI